MIAFATCEKLCVLVILRKRLHIVFLSVCHFSSFVISWHLSCKRSIVWNRHMTTTLRPFCHCDTKIDYVVPSPLKRRRECREEKLVWLTSQLCFGEKKKKRMLMGQSHSKTDFASLPSHICSSFLSLPYLTHPPLSLSPISLPGGWVFWPRVKVSNMHSTTVQPALGKSGPAPERRGARKRKSLEENGRRTGERDEANCRTIKDAAAGGNYARPPFSLTSGRF